MYRTDEFFERSEVPVYPCEVPDYRYNQNHYYNYFPFSSPIAKAALKQPLIILLI